MRARPLYYSEWEIVLVRCPHCQHTVVMGSETHHLDSWHSGD